MARTRRRYAVEARLSAKDDASRTVDRVESRFARFGRTIRENALAIGAWAVAAAGAVRGLSALTRAATEQEVANRRLAAAAARFPDEADRIIESSARVAAEWQRIANVGDETTLTIRALLLDAGVLPERLDEATAAAIDLSAALDRDLIETTRQLGKTTAGTAGELLDLVPGLRDVSEEALRAGAAFEIINEQFGGRAAQLADNYAGAIGSLGSSFVDLFQVLGGVITENTKLQDSIRRLTVLLSSEEATGAVRGFGDALGAAFSGLSEKVSSFASIFSSAIVELKTGSGTVEVSLIALERTAARLGISVEELRKRIEAGAATTRAFNAVTAETAAVVEGTAQASDAYADALERAARIERELAAGRDAFSASLAALGVTLEAEVNQKIEENNALLEEAERLYRLGAITAQDLENAYRAVGTANEEATRKLRNQTEEIDRQADSVGDLIEAWRTSTGEVESYGQASERAARQVDQLAESSRRASQGTRIGTPPGIGGFATIGGGTFTTVRGQDIGRRPTLADRTIN